MNNKIAINFEHILSELKEKNLKLVFINNRGIYIQDNNKGLYQMELHKHCFYLDKLIKDADIIEFDYIEPPISQNISTLEKKIWEISDVQNFMKRQKCI